MAQGSPDPDNAGQAENHLLLENPPAGQTRPLPDGWTPSGPQARPTVRFWARGIDYVILGVLGYLVLAGVYPAASKINHYLFSVLVTMAWLFIEPVCLSLWGTTPGKALLRVRVRKNDGKLPTYSAALGRALNVWVRGLGLCIPIVNWFTLVYAYDKLRKDRVTTWDRDGGFVVTHKEVGIVRTVVAIAVIVSLLFFQGMLRDGALPDDDQRATANVTDGAPLTLIDPE